MTMGKFPCTLAAFTVFTLLRSRQCSCVWLSFIFLRALFHPVLCASFHQICFTLLATKHSIFFDWKVFEPNIFDFYPQLSAKLLSSISLQDSFLWAKSCCFSTNQKGLFHFKMFCVSRHFRGTWLHVLSLILWRQFHTFTILSFKLC